MTRTRSPLITSEDWWAVWTGGLLLAATAVHIVNNVPTVGGWVDQVTAAVSGRLPGLQGVVGTALALRGVAYRKGGSDPNGFDCSGFTQYVFGRHGLELPREVRDQYRFGRAVRREKRAAGDLLFFSTVAAGASHVGIAIGGDEFVHAPSSTGVVRVERLTSSYWSRRFVGARRITPP